MVCSIVFIFSFRYSFSFFNSLNRLVSSLMRLLSGLVHTSFGLVRVLVRGLVSVLVRGLIRISPRINTY